jgi:hypothetical protein
VCAVHEVFASVQVGVIQTLGRATLGDLERSDGSIRSRRGRRGAGLEQPAGAPVKLR